METNEQKQKMSLGKKVLIGLGVFLLIGIIANAGKDINPTNNTNSGGTEASQQSSSTNEKKWTEVYTFKGNGTKKSPVFELTGGNAKIKYTYKATGNIGMGMFAVYVIDEGVDIMKEGGVPEIMSQAENEESESSIQKGAGRYYLEVNASGSWTVTIEEEK